MRESTGKRVVVMGLGLHGGGLSVARWFLRTGADVCVTDLRTRRALSEPVAILREEAAKSKRGTLELVLGEHRSRDFHSADLIVQNPGVPRTSPFLAIARRCRIAVENEASLFFHIIRAATRDRIHVTAVTGTRGKSTTTALIFAMLEEAGRSVFLGGNIRMPIFDSLDAILRSAERGDVEVVLELSSWHCERLTRMTGGPDCAVLTNIMRDHLNRYPSMASYIAAKARIIRWLSRSGAAVCNADSDVIRTIATLHDGATYWFSAKSPRRRRWNGAFVDGGRFVVRDHVGDHDIAATSSLLLPGEHNVVNAAAAIAAARVRAVPFRAIRSALAAFRGLPGRLEVVARRGGVTYINDTCATTPDATIAGLRSLPEASERRIVLIAGGSDKQLHYHAWATVVGESVKAIVLLPGSATEKMDAALRAARQQQLQRRSARSMLGAVRKARALAQKGDVVLMSPGAASFGLFLHEFDRGEQFTNACLAS